ncbi:MAG TPA: porin [Burkholderiales bacterium]|nr:porin [Burkholderiales bacterium]
MQKKLLTAAVAGVLAAPVVAMADVTVYGTIDTGVRSASKVCTAAGGAGCTETGSLLSVTDGERTTNRWGLKGSEDLGGGLRANFTLEGQYGSDNGAGPGSSTPGSATNTGNQGLFQRKSIVGLSGGAWSVDLGRDYTVNFKTQGIYDPMSYTYTGITPTAGNNVAGTRSSNMITAGFRFGTGGIRVDYAMGEVAGDTGSGQRIGANADFAFGPVTLAAAYSTRSDTFAGLDLDQDTYNIGGVYKLGALTFRAGYSSSEYKQTSGGTQKADTPMYALGVQYDFTPAVSGRIGYYNMEFNLNDVKAGSRDWFILAIDYNLSKTTTLYAAVDVSGIKDSSITVSGATGIITAGTAGIGATQGSTVQDGSTGISAGIMHAF